MKKPCQRLICLADLEPRQRRLVPLTTKIVRPAFCAQPTNVDVLVGDVAFQLQRILDKTCISEYWMMRCGSEKRAAQWERRVYDSASEWLAKPWFTVADDPFAFSVCMQNKTCAAAWHRIAELVAKYNLFIEE